MPEGGGVWWADLPSKSGTAPEACIPTEMRALAQLWLTLQPGQYWVGLAAKLEPSPEGRSQHGQPAAHPGALPEDHPGQSLGFIGPAGPSASCSKFLSFQQFEEI